MRHVLLACLVLAGTVTTIGVPADTVAAGQEPDDVPLPERPKLEAKNPLRVELPNVLLNARSGAPIPLDWKLTWSGKGILEGRLKYELVDEGRVIGTFVIEDLAISGQQSFRTMLPAVRFPMNLDAVDVKFTFVGTEKTYEPTPQTVKIPTAEMRHTAILLCDTTDVSLSPDAANLIDSLSLAQFEANKTELVTQNGRFRPQEMPADPHPLCGFDVVAITGQAFQNLREPQLLALREWVEAGGALYVAPGNGLQERHLKLLNDLAREDLAESPFRRNEQGSLVSDSPHGGWLVLHRGLGRAVVNLNLPVPKADQRLTEDRRKWEGIAAFLWRVPPHIFEMSAQGARWPLAEAQPAQQPNFNGRYGYNMKAKSRFYVRYAPVGDWILKHLLPERVQVVPLWLLAAMLGVYLLLIGPAEYFGLGLVRLRRVTWILFPITTVGFTAGILWLSNRYMYSEVQSRSVTFADVIDDGRVVRQTRLELLFTNAHRTLSHELSQAYFTPLNLDAFGANLKGKNLPGAVEEDYAPWDDDARNPWRLQGSQAEKVVYTGRIPAKYTAVQSVPQWTPQFNRWTTLAPRVPKVDFPWTSFSPAEFATDEARGRLARVIQDKFGAKVTAVLYAPRDVGAPDARRPNSTRDIVLASQSGVDPLPVITPLSRSSGAGLSANVTRFSPTGGSNLEDLPLLGAGASDEWLLAIFVPQGDNYVVYRRVYREKK